jgi:hypothetical protein
MSRNRRSGLEAILALLGAVVSAVASVAVAAHLLRREEDRRLADPGSPGSGAQRAPRDQELTETLPTPQPQSPTSGAPALAPQIRPGWHAVTEPLPDPTYWPVVMALGIVFLAWGLISTILLSGVGLLLFVLALAGWIGDLRHEQREHE